jgi:hypothetical protein
MPAEVLEIPEGWEVLTEDKLLIKKIEVEGSGDDHPKKGADVEGVFPSDTSFQETTDREL